MKIKEMIKKVTLKGLPFVIAGSLAFGGAVGLSKKQAEKIANQVGDAIKQEEKLKLDNNLLPENIKSQQKEIEEQEKEIQEQQKEIEEIVAYSTIKEAIRNTFIGYIKETTQHNAYSGNATVVSYTDNEAIEFSERTQPKKPQYSGGLHIPYSVQINDNGVVESADDNFYNKKEGEIIYIKNASDHLYDQLADPLVVYKNNQGNVYEFDIVSTEDKVIGEIIITIERNKISTWEVSYLNGKSYAYVTTYEQISKKQFMAEKERIQDYINEQSLALNQ